MKKFSILIYSPDYDQSSEFYSESKMINLSWINQPSQLYKELILEEYDLIILFKVQGSLEKRLYDAIEQIRPNTKKISLKKSVTDFSSILKAVS
ncbi:hypothetical protein N9N67_10360 [Bacteriovoracaceae bacterium]|nr:hypothetical protein [Bacteriovoracaceae bacterium]